MRVLVVGGGGREHALAWRLAPEAEHVYCAPGNAGIASVAECVQIGSDDIASLVSFARKQSVDLVVVGPEAPLVAGLADQLEAAGVSVFGPRADGAQLEGSKVWARDLCDRHGIPQPWSRSFTEVDEALKFVRSYEGPYVVKADGLAAGKGVTVTPDLAEAESALKASLSDRVFGDAGSRVLVEECMTGPEISALALTDGHLVLPLALAQDHKRVGDGDTGPNTGGMGAYSPVPFVDDVLREKIAADVLVPIVRALEAEGIDYRGLIYAGLMLTDQGPKVLEFNCRFGDPETQALMPRVACGLPEALMASAKGDLSGADIAWHPESCLTVTLASGGYPGDYRTGLPIDGLEAAAEIEGVTVFHSGTATRGDRVVTSGGRVLSVSAVADTLEEARTKAYEACSRISFEGMHHRTDIAAMGVSIG
jgi:phosphoribosylamine--glycine ligase